METVRLLRHINRMSQLEFAKQLGVSHQTVRGWENGSDPNSAQLRKISELFDVSIDWLLADKPIKIPKARR